MKRDIPKGERVNPLNLKFNNEEIRLLESLAKNYSSKTDTIVQALALLNTQLNGSLLCVELPASCVSRLEIVQAYYGSEVVAVQSSINFRYEKLIEKGLVPSPFESSVDKDLAVRAVKGVVSKLGSNS